MTKCNSLKADSSRVGCLIEASKQFLLSDPQHSLVYSEAALQIAESNGQAELHADALKSVALSHGYSGQPEKGKPYYLKAVRLLDKNPQRRGNMFLNLGADYQYVRKYDSSMHYFLQALPQYEEAGDKLGISKVQNNLAVVYRRMGFYSMAIESYRESLQSKQVAGDQEGVMNTYLNLSALYYEIDEPDSVKKYSNLSSQLAKELNDPLTEGLALLNLCLVNSLEGNMDRALKLGKQSEELLLQTNDPRRLCQLYSSLGHINASMGNCDSASIYLNKPCGEGALATSAIRKLRADTRAMCGEQSGNYKEAYYALKDFKAWSDTATNQKEHRALTELAYKYEQEKIRSGVLEKEKALTKSEADRSRLFAIVIAISGVVVILILLIVLLNVRSKRRREKHQAELRKKAGEMDLLQQKLANLADVPLPQMAMDLSAEEVNEHLVNPLTQRELEVLSMIATGKSNKQIADEMFVSVNTVKTHIHRIYDKLDVKNRTEATLKASSLNLITS
ncbi:LuxR C-terminal-related transcriptional regulator [Halocola ammonii]